MWFPGWCRSLRQAYFRRAALACITIVLLAAAGGMVSERLHDSGTIYYRLNLWGAGLTTRHGSPFAWSWVLSVRLRNDHYPTRIWILSCRVSPDIEGGVASHNTLLTVFVEFGALGFLISMSELSG